MSNIITNTLNVIGSTLSLYSITILSVIFAVVLVFIATGKFTIASGVITLVIAGLIYLLASSARGQNLEGSLPSVTYPNPPHLGLDGINLQNRFPHDLRKNKLWQPPYGP